jgi:hypothetical protein
VQKNFDSEAYFLKSITRERTQNPSEVTGLSRTSLIKFIHPLETNLQQILLPLSVMKQ